MIRLVFSFFFAAWFCLSTAMANDTAAILEYDPSVCAAKSGLARTRIERAVAAADSADCLAMMAAFPIPNFERVDRDHFSLDKYSFWRVNRDGANLYNAPGGQTVGMIPAGFNFINVINTGVDGWIQDKSGRWIQREDAKPERPSGFTGMLLPDGWTHPYAIILDRTGVYASQRPGEAASADSGFITRRYRLVNIFARAEDSARNVWYLVGPGQWIRQEMVAKFAPSDRPDDVSGRWVAVDLFEQTLIAYEDDKPVFATVISSGMKAWETDEGVHEVWARLISDSMSGEAGGANAYALQSVPWVMYFNRGQSLHGTYWHDSFGYRRSKGCVNLSISDARWIYDWMLDAAPDEDGEISNFVYVFSTGVYNIT